ncbi:MAG: hypothetical protein FWF50_07320 [Defluviitaleaceae bacterium]|nr:hypothetical protein [Defluviitaleaceae bacterium]
MKLNQKLFSLSLAIAIFLSTSLPTLQAASYYFQLQPISHEALQLYYEAGSVGSTIINGELVQIIPPHEPISLGDGTYITASFYINDYQEIVFFSEQEILERFALRQYYENLDLYSYDYFEEAFYYSHLPSWVIVPERQVRSINWTFTNSHHEVSDDRRRSSEVRNSTSLVQNSTFSATASTSYSITAGLAAQARDWLSSNFGFTFNRTASRTITHNLNVAPGRTVWLEVTPIHTLRRGTLTTRYYDNMGMFTGSSTRQVEVSSPNRIANGTGQVVYHFRER